MTESGVPPWEAFIEFGDTDVFLAARLLRPVGIRDVDYRPEELDHPATVAWDAGEEYLTLVRIELESAACSP